MRPQRPPIRRSHASTAAGVRLWATRYVGGDNLATALGVRPDGSAVFVTGRGSPTGEHGFATVAYDTVTGTELWATRDDGPGTYSYATALGVRPDGSAVFVTGFGLGSTGTDAVTVAYDTGTASRT